MEQPNYFSILTADVRYNKNLSSSEKLFYSEITAMSNKYGYCWASNSYFSKLYGVSNSTISMWVKHLIEQKHIKVDYEKKGKQVTKRMIYPIQNNGQGYSENLNRGSQKIERGYSENLKENITSINNTSSNSRTYKDEYIINLDKDETRKKIDDENEDLHFRMAKAINEHSIKFHRENNTPIGVDVKNVKAGDEMEHIAKLLEHYEEYYIGKVIKWLWKDKENGEIFWRKHVINAKKFHEKFDKMKLAMIGNKQKKPHRYL